MKKITIAVDGYSSCGKSTLAKALAKKLGYVYVDSGAMYRGVTLFAMRNGWTTQTELDEKHIVQALLSLSIRFEWNAQTGMQDLMLNGENVEREIRSIEVANVVSKVAAIQEVRSFLVNIQRDLGKVGGVVMDGRDIGSVVFPFAELKLFVTALPDIRAKRRYEELKLKGEDVSLDAVIDNLKRRDYLDTTRAESPLIQVPDAVVLDNSNLSREEQLEIAFQLALERVALLQE